LEHRQQILTVILVSLHQLRTPTPSQRTTQQGTTLRNHPLRVRRRKLQEVEVALTQRLAVSFHPLA